MVDADNAVVFFGFDFHQDRAVVDDEFAAFCDVVHEVAVVDGGGEGDGGLGAEFTELDEVA